MTRTTRPQAIAATMLPQATFRQHIRLCHGCRHMGAACQPGLDLLAQLSATIAASGMADGFELSGTACLDACPRPCTVAWRISEGAGWLFGDVAEGCDIDALVSLAQIAETPGAAPDPAAMPAAMIVTRSGRLQ